MSAKLIVLLGGVGGFIVPSGCNYGDEYDNVIPATRVASYAIDTSIRRPSEERLLKISQKVDSFAGYYCSNGDLVIGLAAPIDQSLKDSVLQLPELVGVSTACYNRSVGLRVPQITFVAQKYNFLSLRTWRDSITHDYLEINGSHSIGIDFEMNNVILSGNATSQSQLESFALAQDLPPDAFTFIPETPAQLTLTCPPAPYNGTTVNNCFRPVPGGVQMQPTPNGAGTSPYGHGTITAATSLFTGGYWQPGFVTCGHCVPPTSLMQSDWFHQSTMVGSSDQFIGVEFKDPAGWQCGSYRCRYSDSAWVWHYQGGVDQGRIVQTLGWNSNKTVSTTHPRFNIWGSLDPVQGMQVEKVGQATGWTT